MIIVFQWSKFIYAIFLKLTLLSEDLETCTIMNNAKSHKLIRLPDDLYLVTHTSIVELLIRFEYPGDGVTVIRYTGNTSNAIMA